MLLRFVVALSMTGSSGQALAAQLAPTPTPASVEINTVLMQSTAYLEGPHLTEPGKSVTGSGVVVMRPCGPAAPTRGRFTLVTAAHVLEKMGDSMKLRLPVRQKDGSWQATTTNVQLRNRSMFFRPPTLWKKHPDADVAAIDVSIPIGPDGPHTLPVALFATDEILETFEVHPGDEVMTLGFPLGVSSSASGFALLRSGRISSFPLTPQRTVKTFKVDMEVLPGNSGGPVYFVDTNRYYKGAINMGGVRFLMGIVTDQISAPDGTPLHFTRVAHASFVLETIGMMAPPNCS